MCQMWQTYLVIPDIEQYDIALNLMKYFMLGCVKC